MASAVGGYVSTYGKDEPMGIEVKTRHVGAGQPTLDDPECTRCGTCVDGCLGEILSLGFAAPNTARTDADRTDREP